MTALPEVAGAEPESRVDTTVRELARLDPEVRRANAAYLAGTWATIGAAAVVAARTRRWWSVGLAAVVISGRQQALLNVEHECIHGLFTRGRRRNDRVGEWLCAAPAGSPYRRARATHLAHHRLLDQHDDPDRELHAAPRMGTRRGLAGHFAGGLAGGYAMRVFTRRTSTGETGDGRDLRSVASAQALLWAGSAAALGWWVYPVLWAAPLGTITAANHLLRSFGEHALTPDEEAAGATRLISTDSNTIERWLVAPFNMNLHAEHHLHPYVPATRLRRLRRHMDADASAPARIRRRSYLRNLVDQYRARP